MNPFGSTIIRTSLQVNEPSQKAKNPDVSKVACFICSAEPGFLPPANCLELSVGRLSWVQKQQGCRIEACLFDRVSDSLQNKAIL